MCRMDDICRGVINKNFFSSKKEIILKLKHLTTSDVEKVFKKALEVSQQCKIQSISTDRQAPPPNSDSQERSGSISHWLNSIENALSREFSENFGSANREDKLDTLLDELKSKIDDLTSGRSRSQPQCTPWQHWKSEACSVIGTSRQGQKSIRMFRCYDDNC